jgi:hypothetical protein
VAVVDHAIPFEAALCVLNNRGDIPMRCSATGTRVIELQVFCAVAEIAADFQYFRSMRVKC